MTYDGEERRADYNDNGIHEEDGTIVKRVTLTTIYRKLKTVEHNQNEICEKFNDLSERVGEVNGHKQLLENHIIFCESHRVGMTHDVANREAYERGRLDVEEDAQRAAEERVKRAMYFWAKIIIPATALLFGALYYFLDRLIM